MSEFNTYAAGIDIGSTTVKLCILDENGRLVYGEYRRHHAHTQETLADLLSEARTLLGPAELTAHITGSGSIGLSKALGIPFTQEVVAVADALAKYHPETDVAIELGGEDAKIIYFRGGLDERMNGVCAGGTGSFIDQMAALLKTDASGLNEAAKEYKQIYTIAARCGVFAKSDIQPLINEGASKADLAASIFQAVVNQTISGLACGKPIRGCVAFLGGPLHYLSELKAAFIRTLKLSEKEIADPENSHLFAAIGAAMQAGEASFDLDELIRTLRQGVKMDLEIKRLDPLFRDEAEYDTFLLRHRKAAVKRGDLSSYRGKCFLGIDAGSTTTKLAVVGEQGELLYSTYANNQGSPIEVARRAMAEIEAALPDGVEIARSCSTGYGEALLKAAFRLDEGEVETVAHTTAAAFFEPDVDCVLDIGGQDMKYIKIRNHTVDTVILNEACSSGCGSFIENFAASLGLTAQEFAKEALFAELPIDLGTRCTVFMNSNVKQAQKEGARVSDISAGLAYSVIKNALFKVIKLADARQLGSHIVVQGGTFYNQAVLRAFEKVAGTEVICPDISGIMGAFGAALIARDRYTGEPSGMRTFREIADLRYTSRAARCGGCENNCMLTINTFEGGGRFVSGNRCEKKISSGNSGRKGVNLIEYKRNRIFGYEPLPEKDAYRGTIGIPRVLNMYENYPYWATFFKALGFRTVLSPFSSRSIYESGMESIPSESECYPAKLAHGHIQWLFDHGVRTVFHPCVFYEYQETPDSENHYNCPMVASYAENLKNNVEAVTSGEMKYLRPFIAFTSEKTAADRLVRFCRKEWKIPAKEVRSAAHEAWLAQRRAKDDIRREGTRVLQEMTAEGRRGIVLAGRPYHIDPEINHGIPEMICSYGLDVFTEDSLPYAEEDKERPLRVVDQWVFHSRLYNAAELLRKRDDLEIIQLFSFGCGLDAVTTDQVQEILEKSGKLYTVLKIDEVGNLGAARIRVRSLLAAMEMRSRKNIRPDPKPVAYRRTEFTKQMFDEGYTILAPAMSPIHFDLLTPVFRKYGYRLEMLNNTTRKAIDLGLQYVNNDACYPSIIVTGQMMEAVLSGQYDTDRLALLMSQTGGCCRASNYIAFIRRALDKAGLSHIPVISLNANGMEKNEGFTVTVPMLLQAFQALMLGDLLMRCLYRTRPYEEEPGAADRLKEKWQQRIITHFTAEKPAESYKALCHGIVRDFDVLPLKTAAKPRVGIVGEILVKYMPLANNHLVELLEKEGAEAVVPDLLDFFEMSMFGKDYQHKYLGKKVLDSIIARVGVAAIEGLRRPAVAALKESRRFSPPKRIERIAEPVKPFLSLGNQYGEGWFLCGEMVELLDGGVDNIICIQPFACLPNHVMGKGVIKALKAAYPQANIAAVDYDPGASEVNQLNRIKLMLSAADKAARSR